MSRHNRVRRAWKCTKCKAPMWRNLEAHADRLRRESGNTKVMVHVCGACKTCHYKEGDSIRALTPAEMLVLHIEVPRTLGAIQAGDCDPIGNQMGTIVFGDE
ncbi:MAG: hypothetical protein C0467_30065 [Planctomycetaceae bacterium]|nr:hypothetical protein [Planctomycetaceae bacterium]